MGWFEQMSGAGKMLVTAAVLLTIVAGLMVLDWIRFSRPRRFTFEDRVYFFHADRRRRFWQYPYKHGHFVHEDGSPIADEALAARIWRAWLNSFSGGDAGAFSSSDS